MANKKETKRITNILNTIYNNNKFMLELCNLCNNNYNTILFSMGDILEYYITSRDKRILSLEEMNVVVGLFKYIGTNKDYRVYNIKDNETPIKCLRRNIIRDGYMTRSINTYFIKGIKRHGLGNNKSIDSKFNKYMSYLESVLGTNNYSIFYDIVDNQFCMSSPGANSFYNAGSNSPIRFFLGILGQPSTDILPLTIGESKINYFKRVFDKKLLTTTLDKKTLSKVKKTCYKLIKLLCKDKPSIMLIPLFSDNYSLKVTKEYNDSYNVSPISDWIFLKLMNESPMTFFSRDFGEANEDLGNIISFNTIVPYKELGILKVPDRYTIMQYIAKNKGYKKNEKFSYLTGEIIKEKISE